MKKCNTCEAEWDSSDTIHVCGLRQMLSDPPFVEFPSIARLSRVMIVTEKIDGTNASITVLPDGRVLCGSRNRYITPEADNFGFARWVKEREDAIRTGLGFGTHYGEWWGSGIQRGYGLKNGEKRFSLFNTTRWRGPVGGEPVVLPEGISTVPVLLNWTFDTAKVDEALADLAKNGSQAAPGFMSPEGVVVFHTKSKTLFKKTLDKNDGHKGA